MTEFEAIRDLFRRFGFPIDSEADWRPQPDDWLRLSLGLALKHGERGFKFSDAPVRRAEWAEWVRRGVMDANFLEQQSFDTPEGNAVTLTDRPRGATYKEAAAAALRQWDVKGRVGEVKRPSAKTLDTEYSKHRANLERGGDHPALPSLIQNVLDRQRRFLEWIKIARNYSAPAD